MKLDAVLFSPVSAEITHRKVADRSSRESLSLCTPSERSATPTSMNNSHQIVRIDAIVKREVVHDEVGEEVHTVVELGT